MQHLLPFGTPEQVRRTVRERIEILGAGGGYVLSSSHNLLKAFPLENILAMYDEAAKKLPAGRARDIFEHQAQEEQHHFALLKNTYDYMADPEGFAGFDENPMLDGG